MVIPAGEFWMGSPESEAERSGNERRHRVSVEAFAMGQYAVTFAEYDRFCTATGRDKPDDAGWGRGDRPVINVSWYDAVAYRAPRKTGHEAGKMGKARCLRHEPHNIFGLCPDPKGSSPPEITIPVQGNRAMR